MGFCFSNLHLIHACLKFLLCNLKFDMFPFTYQCVLEIFYTLQALHVAYWHIKWLITINTSKHKHHIYRLVSSLLPIFLQMSFNVDPQDAPKQLAFRKKGPGRPKVEHLVSDTTRCLTFFHTPSGGEYQRKHMETCGVFKRMRCSLRLVQDGQPWNIARWLFGWKSLVFRLKKSCFCFASICPSHSWEDILPAFWLSSWNEIRLYWHMSWICVCVCARVCFLAVKKNWKGFDVPINFRMQIFHLDVTFSCWALELLEKK